MKHSPNKRPLKWPKVSPWIILATVIGSMALAAIMFNRDYRREQGYLTEMFLQRGEVLIHSLESFGRFQRGQGRPVNFLKDFWDNLEESEEVLFLALTDTNGQVQELVGSIAPPPTLFANPSPPLKSGGTILPNTRIEKIGDRSVYVVYRPLLPFPGRGALAGRQKGYKLKHGEGMHGDRMQGDRVQGDRVQGATPRATQQPKPTRYLWIGFDMSSFEKVTQSRVRTAGIFICIFCLSVLAGVLALIWGHHSRLARQMYQDTNALAAELIGRLPTGVIIKDANGHVTLVNQATTDISGLTESQWLGRTPEELTSGHFPTAEILTAYEIELAFVDGQNVRVALTAGPVVSDDGHPLGQLILMENLGELGRLKAELAQKEHLAALGTLAAGLAHEIRNPLGAIKGLSHHLLKKLAPADSTTPPRTFDESDREALEVMLTSVERLNDTITDFLHYSRPAVIQTAPLDLVELLRKMVALSSHDARTQAVSIKQNLPFENVTIQGDEAALSQAFLNLFLNAIEAAAQNNPQGEGSLEVSLKIEQERAHLTFQDNGPGFSPEQLAQPFVPYFTTKAQGTGLGLAQVAKTIRAHQGASIGLASPPSGGGQVTITFQLIGR